MEVLMINICNWMKSLARISLFQLELKNLEKTHTFKKGVQYFWLPKTLDSKKDELCNPNNRVIQIGQKWQTWYFATFLARFRIFWKMMFGKMQKFFWYDHSNACRKCPKVLLHNAPMWNGAKQKIQFFQFFQK